MCDFHNDLSGLPQGDDLFILDTSTARANDPAEAIAAIRPAFERFLRNETWLPADYQADAPASGMGGGIGQWLLSRSADHGLCLFSLVVAPRTGTPIHDHPAWGLIGLYRGAQAETVFARRNAHAPMTSRRRRSSPSVPGT